MQCEQRKRLRALRRDCAQSIAAQQSRELSDRGESAPQRQRRSGSALLRAPQTRLSAEHHG
jgi:hypothetical protein